MARQAKVVLDEKAPATLPADFSEWDSGEPPATLPDNFSDFDPALTSAAAAKPAAAPAVGPHGTGRLPEFTVSRAPATARAEAVVISGPLAPRRAEVAKSQEPEIEGQRKRKGIGLFAVIAAILLLAVVISAAYWVLFKPAPKTAAPGRQGIPQAPVAANPQPAGLPKPSPSPSPAAQQFAAETTAEETAGPAPAKPDSMTSQLNATPRISKAINSGGGDTATAASGFSPGSLGDLGGNAAAPGVFGSQARPKVVGAPSIVKLSAGVVQGMLIHNVSPVYPALARAARVSGTVVLEVTISKAGTIEGMHIVSGPEMLRQAAMDAVRSWRYRPFRLDNEPVEVDATVNVVFSLGG